MLKLLKKVKCKIFFCCKSKCSINDDDYQTRNNEKYIVDKINFSTFI
jgi:hypothetical protein